MARLKRPRDPVELGKLIGDIHTGQVEHRDPTDKRNDAAAEMGRKGGAARAKALTSERRAEIARKAAAKRWQKGRNKSPWATRESASRECTLARP